MNEFKFYGEENTENDDAVQLREQQAEKERKYKKHSVLDNTALFLFIVLIAENTILFATRIFFQEEITLDLTIEALKGTITPMTNFKNDIQKIQRVVAEHYNVSVEDLKSKKRVATIAFPRQIAIYLSRQLTDESFPKIGIEFGGRDHSTVMHSCDKIEKERKENKQLDNIINEIISKLE